MPDYLVRMETKAPAEDAEPVVTERLVRAPNQARAIAHVVNDTVTVAVAETEDVIRLAKAGVDLEVAE